MQSQTRRSNLVRVISAVICLCVGTVAFASMASWWGGLTQSQRTNYILSRAQQDIDRNVGMECKEWVRRVLRDASRGEVRTPPNRNDYTWDIGSNYPNIHLCRKPYPIDWVQPGDIIQMKINGGPHTAIVLRRTSTEMTWIDSNWQNQTRPMVVTTHTYTFRNFERNIGNNYNIYQAR